MSSAPFPSFQFKIGNALQNYANSRYSVMAVYNEQDIQSIFDYIPHKIEKDDVLGIRLKYIHEHKEIHIFIFSKFPIQIVFKCVLNSDTKFYEGIMLKLCEIVLSYENAFLVFDETNYYEKMIVFLNKFDVIKLEAIDDVITTSYEAIIKTTVDWVNIIGTINMKRYPDLEHKTFIYKMYKNVSDEKLLTGITNGFIDKLD